MNLQTVAAYVTLIGFLFGFFEINFSTVYPKFQLLDSEQQTTDKQI